MDFANCVRQFNLEAGLPAPNHPEELTKNDIQFLIKMIFEEIIELFDTIFSENESEILIKILNQQLQERKNRKVEHLLSDQADALGDMIYFIYNCACKKGINLTPILMEIHQANMNKKDPITNQFLKREDGKIIKPENWQPPNVKNIILNQCLNGSFK